MKCLSLKQPFAELLVSGRKTIELRNWTTKFRGEFLVHASKNIDRDGCKVHGFDPEKITKGAVVGKAVIYDVKEYLNESEFFSDKDKHLAVESIYATDRYGFLIKDAERFDKPIPMPGKLNFFEVEEW